MGPFEMVVAIVIVVTIGKVASARMGWSRDRGAPFAERDDPAAAAENVQLRSEVRALKERVQVLERVITDNEGSLRLDREIERLRDHNRI